jgi:hypothetical protein
VNISKHSQLTFIEIADFAAEVADFAARIFSPLEVRYRLF